VRFGIGSKTESQLRVNRGSRTRVKSRAPPRAWGTFARTFILTGLTDHTQADQEQDEEREPHRSATAVRFLRLVHGSAQVFP